LNLPHPIDPATGILATNKLRQRESLAAANVPQPRWETVTDGDVSLPVPCVVKAPDRQGQKGLSLVREQSELASAIDKARAESRNGVALVEELVDGPEVTVIGYSHAGRYTALAVTDRIVADPPAFGVALAHVWPSVHAGEAAAVARQGVEALGIMNGPTYAQLRVGADGPKVIEIAARLGGGHDGELVWAATGVDLNALALAAAFGTAGEPAMTGEGVGGAVTRFLVPPEGTLESVEVPDDLVGVERVRLYRSPGHQFGPFRYGSDRAGAVLAVGGSRDEAVERAEVAADRIRFVTADAGALV
jgi:biotin carboxylase